MIENPDDFIKQYKISIINTHTHKLKTNALLVPGAIVGKRGKKNQHATCHNGMTMTAILTFLTFLHPWRWPFLDPDPKGHQRTLLRESRLLNWSYAQKFIPPELGGKGGVQISFPTLNNQGWGSCHFELEDQMVVTISAGLELGCGQRKRLVTLHDRRTNRKCRS